MALIIHLKTLHSPGVLARVIGTIHSAGLQFERHQLDDSGLTVRLSVHAQGKLGDIKLLESKLKSVKGVIEVLGIRGQDGAQLGTSVAQGIVQQIVEAFPEIVQLLAQHREQVQSELQSAALHRLGVEVALIRSNNLSVPQNLPLDEGLDLFLAPLLEGLALPEIYENEIRVARSIFTSADNTGQRPRLGLKAAFGLGPPTRCDFLAGYIEGAIQHLTSSQYQVTETYCRKDGQPFCLFALQHQS